MDCVSIIVETVIAAVTIAASLAVTKWTMSIERRKMVSELKRNAYMSVLSIIVRIQNNPTVIFQKKTIDELNDASVAVDVYGAEDIKKSLDSFIQSVSKKYYEYEENFETNNNHSTREMLKKNWAFAEMLDQEEIDYMVANMPTYADIIDLAEALKKEIAETLRKG